MRERRPLPGRGLACAGRIWLRSWRRPRPLDSWKCIRRIIEGVYFNDLLPLPYTQEALDLVAGHIGQVQERLRRRILIENPSSYLRYLDSTLSEPAFLSALIERTGCGLLCDINNIHVS